MVTSKLEDVTNEIVPSLGATVHTIGRDQIDAIPQGGDAPFQQILLRAPGVVQDSFGEVHVRGEHGNLQYRVNGVLLPESLNGFAQEVDTRLAASVTLTDGSLPAQIGFRTSGVVDVLTKTGDQLRGGEIGLFEGRGEPIWANGVPCLEDPAQDPVGFLCRLATSRCPTRTWGAYRFPALARLASRRVGHSD